MVRVDVVHRIMEQQTNTNILFLDACRDNPLTRNLARAMGTRSADIGKGLSGIQSGVGTLISFSTQPDNVALDGTGRNSPFAAALVKHLSTSTDDLSAILIAVRSDVMKETQRKQIPWEHSALTGRFYFKVTAPAPELAKAAPPLLSEAAEAWDRVKDSSSIAVLESYATRYKETIYAELARARLEDLHKQKVAAVSSKEPPMPQAKNLQHETRFSLLQNTELVGRTRVFSGEQTDLDACTKKCIVETSCQAFSFNRANRFCYLIDHVTSRQNDTSFTSGILRFAGAKEDNSQRMEKLQFSILDNIEIVGRTRTYSGQQTDPDRCSKKCLAETSCQAFSFNKINRFCYLIDGVTSMTSDPSFVSARLR
jgi:hypothetical protein